MASANYTAKDITVLEGLEPVRKRPGMYIGGVGTAGLHHLVWEILDNSVDEAMNGYASNIGVTLHKDGSSITDRRRRPRHPGRQASEDKKSALEVIFTALHAGGKFEHGNYKTAGGLHGVGASVVNALSKELVATVKRDGAQWEMRFKQGKPVGALKKLGPARGTGTTVYFHPDAAIFPKIEFDPADHPRAARGRQLPAQGPEGHVRGRERRRRSRSSSTSEGHRRVPEEDRRRARREAGARRAVHADEGRRRCGSTSCCSGPRRPTSTSARYVNGIPTGSGGTHENGLRAGIGKAVRNYIETHNLSPKGVTLTAEDIREGLTGVLSVFIAGAAVPGPDQGSAEQPRARCPRSTALVRPGARALAEPQHQRRRGDRRAHHPRGARARGQPRARRPRSRARARRRTA